MAGQPVGELPNEADLHPGWGLDGEALHGPGGVPPHRWCVTRKDLIFLRAQIKKAVRDGCLRKTERDQFDPKDDKVGPNMYAVVEQYIKPLTLKAGKMSWALLRNPEGVDCHLFITHAWCEGAFEFIDKVLASWPPKVYAAWCCILANPQNLDISDLIRVPRNSPFALALRKASKMMVVPNRQCSIYTRVWCVYEAYLAMAWDKEVFIACSPLHWGWNSVPYVILATAWVVVGNKWSDTDHDFQVEPRPVISLLFLCLAFVIKLVHELLWQRQQQAEGRSLSNNFVDVANAQSSDPIDKAKIIFEISNKVERVNRAVVLLQRVGMFTPGLRRVMERNVHLRGIGQTVRPMLSWLACFVQVAFFTYSPAPGNSPNSSRACLLLSIVEVLCYVGFPGEFHQISVGMKVDLACGFVKTLCLAFVVIAFHSQNIDQKAFSHSLSVKLTSLTIAVSAPAYASWSIWPEVDLTFLNVGLTFATVVAAICALIGVSGISSIPLVGAGLVEASWPGFWRSIVSRKADGNDNSSEASDESANESSEETSSGSGADLQSPTSSPVSSP